jgi:flagellar basal body-associated protein FliL
MLKTILSNTLKVINAVSQVILIITALISLFTAYVIFAPNEFPKPFRLVYDTSAESPVLELSPAVVEEAPTAEPEEHTAVPGEGVMVNMSTKIINLVDPTGHRYIRLTVVAEFAPENAEYESLPEEEKSAYLAEFQDKLNARMPVMDDTVITLLSTKTYEELYTADGKEKLRAEIMDGLAHKLPDMNLLSIYFTEFVVQ